jgi:hypothetical protein
VYGVCNTRHSFLEEFMTLNTVSTFTDIFSGNRNAYGQFIPAEQAEEGQKQEGSCSTVRNAVSESLYRAHLEGSKGLGICPVNEEGKCKFSVIDVDVYNHARDYLLTVISENDLPLLPFKSKSGGWHLYTFYTDFVSAKEARANANFLRTLLGLPNETEIFPKQDIVPSGGTGNWINLPYFGGDNSPRCLIDQDGTSITNVDIAVANIVQRRITLDQFKTWKTTIPLNDAPPCLQSLYLRRNVTERNNYLFSLGCYYKAKYGEEYENYLRDANARLTKPLSEKELQQTVLSSLNKHTYSYRCHEVPLSGLCNKKECAKREYKVGDVVSQLSYEQLVQYNCDPPYYDWTINGKPLRFNSEAEIIQQEKFIELCMRHLSILPNKIKREAWTAIVNEALKNKITKEIEFDTSSPLAIMQESLRQYMLNATLGDTLEDCITSGRPYITGMQQIITTMKDLYLAASQATKLKFTSRDIANWLYGIGAQASTRKVRMVSTRVWIVDLTNLFDTPEELKEWWLSKQSKMSGIMMNGQLKDAKTIAREAFEAQMEDDL